MTKIYLVRHAEAEGNLYRIAHGHYNGLITDWRGPKQIRALAQRFEGIRVDAVYSSDLYRTQTTAQAVYVPKHLPLHTSPAFREVHMGAWEGHTWQEVSRLWPEEFYHFNRRIDLWQPEGGENARQVLERYLPALEEVARAHDGETIALFSHGAALRIVLGTLQGLTLREVGTSPHGDNTAVSLLEYGKRPLPRRFPRRQQPPDGQRRALHLRQADLVEKRGRRRTGHGVCPHAGCAACAARRPAPRRSDSHPPWQQARRRVAEPHRGRRRLGRLVLARARVARAGASASPRWGSSCSAIASWDFPSCACAAKIPRCARFSRGSAFTTRRTA